MSVARKNAITKEINNLLKNCGFPQYMHRLTIHISNKKSIIHQGEYPYIVSIREKDKDLANRICASLKQHGAKKCIIDECPFDNEYQRISIVGTIAVY